MSEVLSADGADLLEPASPSRPEGVTVDEPGDPAAGATGVSPGAVAAGDAVELLKEKLLLRRLKRGDEYAFAELVKTHQDRVFDLVFRMIGDREEALDLSQEIFVSVHGSVARFRGDSRLSTWIFRIARNHCLNRLKYLGRRERGRSTELSDVDEGELASHNDAQPADEQISARETQKLVQTAIAELPEEYRLLVVLRDVEGLSYSEIAAITDQPEGTVKSRLHRARSALADLIEKHRKE